jgi:hypothetical protein
MRRIAVTASHGAGNVYEFTVEDAAGVPVDLDALGATAVDVTICGRNAGDTIAAEFAGANISIKFGLLDVPTGQYRPRVSYYTDLNPDGVVIAGEGFETEIHLKMIC